MQELATRAELAAFAEQHRVQDALKLCAETLVSGDSLLRYTLQRLPLRDVASRESALRYLGPANADLVVRAARERLDRAADSIREALARESEIVGSATGELGKRLLALRTAMRERAVPRWPPPGELRFDERGPALIWKEAERIVRPGIDYSPVTVTARLTVPRAELVAECSCAATACTHVIAAIDAALTGSLPAGAAESLLRPPWQRALLELERLEIHAAKPVTPIEVWWELETELGVVTATPVVRKQSKRGLSAGARMTAGKLLAEHRTALADVDLAAAEHVASFVPQPRTATYPARGILALVGHPRVVTEWSEGQPVAVVRVPLGFAAHPVDGEIHLEPVVEGARMRPDHIRALLLNFAPGEPLFLSEPERNRVLLVDVSDHARALFAVLERHGGAFPAEAHTSLLERLATLDARVPVSIPEQLKGRRLGADTRPVLRLRLLPDVTLELELFVRPAPGAPIYPPNSGPRDVMVELPNGERAYVRRDLGEEISLVRGAFARLPLPDGPDAIVEGPPGVFTIRDANDALALVAALQDQSHVDIEWVDQQKISVTGKIEPQHLRVRVERRHDWFGIDGDVKMELGTLELAVVLDAARRQQRFVRVDDNRFVELSARLREKLQAVADQTFVGKKRLELSPGGVGAIRAIVEAGGKVTATQTWNELTDKMLAARTLNPKVPVALAAELRDYQVEGHAWLTRVAAWGAGACLADDMGLGKTVQAIAVLLDRTKHGPALVIAPTSVAANWAIELGKFAPTLRPILYASNRDLSKLKTKDVVIASYGLLVADADNLSSIEFGTLVVDEAQALKNPNTKRAKAARAIRAKFRIALTGTPLENHLGELWSLFTIVFPGLLGSWDQFRDRFAVPIEKVKSNAAKDSLARVIRPFLLRRTKAEVARELPARTEIQVPIALSTDEHELYETARLAAVAELADAGKTIRDEQRRFAVLAALTRLRLLASHPRLYDPKSPLASSKLKRLVELVEELRDAGHRALVFSQFTSHLALVREELDRAGFVTLYLDGSTPAGQRQALIDRFQRGEGDLFLISLKAGGTGINLTAADYVIHLDPWWNPAVEDQATDRAHRIGQTKPVTVLRLITRGTIEEQMLAMHKEKRTLVNAVLEGTDVAARLTTRDLLRLLEGAPRSELMD